MVTKWSDEPLWKVVIFSDAHRDLRELDDAVWHEAMGLIAALEEDPFPPGSILLRGMRNVYRLRFYGGQYRMIYQANEKERKIVIRRVRPRRDAYQGLDRW